MNGREVCEGFHWVGQPWSSCDNCGRPHHEHRGMWRPKAGSGPFDPDGAEIVAWDDLGKPRES